MNHILYHYFDWYQTRNNESDRGLWISTALEQTWRQGAGKIY